jgi:hypothetical protein
MARGGRAFDDYNSAGLAGHGGALGRGVLRVSASAKLLEYGPGAFGGSVARPGSKGLGWGCLLTCWHFAQARFMSNLRRQTA